MRNICLVMLALASVASGCDGCDDDGGNKNDMSMGGVDMAMKDASVPTDATMPPYTYSQFAVDYAKALCAHYVSCGFQDQATLDVCITKNTLLVGWDVDSEIVRGRVTVNPTDCLNAIKTSLCDNADNGSISRICGQQSVLVPHQKVGETCLASSECTTGYCVHATVDGGSGPQPVGCAGVCANPLSQGQPCTSAEQCGSSLVCSFTSNPTCIPPLADGVSCDFLTDTCLPSSYCPVTGTSPVCTPANKQAALHEACDPAQSFSFVAKPPCATTDLYCKLVQNPDNSYSATCESKIASGGTCDPNFGSYKGGIVAFSQVDSQCVDGTVCSDLNDGNGPRCHPWGALNAACVSFGESKTCQFGYRCEAGTCQVFKPNGSTCAGRGECASETGVNSTCVVANADAGGVMTCQAYKAFGAACVPVFEDNLCVSGSLAADGTSADYCAPAPNGGGVCAPKCF
jgi:hypothetical protein